MKMERNNMEKEFSKKLNEREIQPSPMAWDRLDAMLAVSEEKAVKKYNWLYIAAGFLGFLFIGTMLFMQTEQMTDTGKTEVVIENKTIDTVKDSVETSPNLESIKPIYENQIQNTVASEEKVKIKTSEKIKQNTPSNKNPRETILEKRQESVAVNQENQINNQSIINQKTEQKSAKTSTYVNVDGLLASVETAPKTKKPSIKVDAQSLLSQVDGELELSFREKVIQAANKQYKNVKVAISNRNVQE